MNGYSYNGAYVGHGMDHGDDAQDNGMMMMDQSGMAMTGTMGGQSLDDIVNNNAKMIRRQSMPQGYGTSPQHLNADMRRVSMLDYASHSPAGSMADYQYDPNQSLDQTSFASGQVTPAAASNPQRRPQGTPHHRRQSGGELSLNTQFANNPQNYTNSIMPPNSAYAASPAHPQNSMDLSAMDSPYIDSSMGVNMDYGMDQNMNATVAGDAMPINLYSQPQFTPSNLSSPMHQQQQHQGTPQSGRMSSHDQVGNNSVRSQYSGHNRTPASHASVRHLQRTQSLNVPDMNSPSHGVSPLSAPPTAAPAIPQRTPSHSQSHSQPQSQQPTPGHKTPGMGGFTAQPQNPQAGSYQDRPVGQVSAQGFNGVNGPVPVPVTPQNYNPNNQNFPWEAPEGGWPSTMVGKPHMTSAYKNAYSSTGFDMLGVLVSFAAFPSHSMTANRPCSRCASRRALIPKSTSALLTCPARLSSAMLKRMIFPSCTAPTTLNV